MVTYAKANVVKRRKNPLVIGLTCYSRSRSTRGFVDTLWTQLEEYMI